jgi:hypothetical protein
VPTIGDEPYGGEKIQAFADFNAAAGGKGWTDQRDHRQASET